MFSERVCYHMERELISTQWQCVWQYGNRKCNVERWNGLFYEPKWKQPLLGVETQEWLVKIQSGWLPTKRTCRSVLSDTNCMSLTHTSATLFEPSARCAARTCVVDPWGEARSQPQMEETRSYFFQMNWQIKRLLFGRKGDVMLVMDGWFFYKERQSWSSVPGCLYIERCLECLVVLFLFMRHATLWLTMTLKLNM